MIRLTLPVPPSANRFYRKYRNRMVISDEGTQYKHAVAALGAKHTPLAGDVSVTWRWYRAQKSGDLDNRGKCLLDSLQGVLYLNDKQIVRLVAERYDDKHNPRVEVEVTRATA
jgi:crossover junction endodeoxyribonuclease RusA